MNVPGMFGGGMGGQAGLSPEMQQQVMIEKYMKAGMESCPAKGIMSGVAGAGLGAMFGLFMSSMRYDTPMTAAGDAIKSLPVRQQLAAGLKDMGRSAYSSGKNFGMIGAIFAGTECCIEGFRAKNDLYNGVAAGCLTGGALAMNAGPQGMVGGCLAFAAFSAAIDAYMRMEPEDNKRPVI